MQEQSNLLLIDPHGNEYGGSWIGPNLVRLTWEGDNQTEECMPSYQHAQVILGTWLKASIVTLSGWAGHGGSGGWFTTLGALPSEGEDEILIIGTIPDHLHFPGSSIREVRDVETLCAALQAPTFTRIIIGETGAMPFPNTKHPVWFWSLACGLGAARFPTVCVVSLSDVKFVQRVPYHNDPGWERALCAATDHLEEWVDGGKSCRQTRPGCEEEWDRVADEAFKAYAAAHPRPMPEGIHGVFDAKTVTEEQVRAALMA